MYDRRTLIDLYDRRTLIGSTITKIASDCNVARNHLVSSLVKNMSYFVPPGTEQWRIPVLCDLLDVRNGKSSIPELEPKEVNLIIDEICIN